MNNFVAKTKGDHMETSVLTIGLTSGDLIGRTNLVIQAAIDHLAHLGGGTVRIGEGTYEIASTIHLRSNVRLEGVANQTVLLQSAERVSPLLTSADQHERQITVQDPDYFPIGQTVSVRNAQGSMGFGETVAIVIGKEGNILHLDREMNATVQLHNNGCVSTQTPVISGYDCEQVEICNLTVEGNNQNQLANGCRHAGIFLFGAQRILIESCTVRNYNGDGISYQHCSDISISGCECVRNGGKGIHPGSGTKRTHIKDSRFVDNGMDGIFLCWRVQDSIVEHCVAIGNQMSGLSIGHKDTHNLIRFNRLSDNRFYGIFFRNESDPMAANYNRIESNVLEDNGSETMGYVGIRMRGHTHDVDLIANQISFSKAVPLDRTIGICLEEHTRDIRMEDNEFSNCVKTTHSHWHMEDSIEIGSA
jgi:parallel beta-helix repeat protein